MIRRIVRAVAGLSPWVRRRRDHDAVLAAVPPRGISAIGMAMEMGWSVEKAIKVLGRLVATGHLEAKLTDNRRLFVRKGR